jgi:hypothetical protein
MMLRKASLAAFVAAAVLLGLVPAVQAELRVSPNYNLASDPSAFRARDQVGLAVHRTDKTKVAAVNANYLDLVCEGSRSTDAGATWSRAVPLLPPDPTGGDAPFSKRCAFHQSVEFGSGDNVYAIVTANRTLPALPDANVLVYKSTDAGATWGRGVIALAGGPGRVDSSTAQLGPSYSRPTLAVDPGVNGVGDKVYAIARDTVGTGNNGTTPACTSGCGSSKVAVSTDSAATFATPVNVSPVGVNTQDSPVGAVNSDGSLTIIWRDVGRVAQLQATRSTTPGTPGSWSTPINIATVRNTGTSTATHVPPADGATGASTSATYPRVAADPTRAGWIYLVYGQSPPGPLAPAGGTFAGTDHFISPDTQAWFQRSKDRGLTWSQPKLISDATNFPGSLVQQVRQPNVGVSPTGRVNVVWHDRRHWFQNGIPAPGNAAVDAASRERTCSHSHSYCEDIRLGDTYYSSSTNGGDTFSPNIRINDRSHNNDVGYDTRPASGYWSWGPVVVTVAGDQDLVGWMDSREGNWDTDTEDFYLAKVNHDATGADPQTAIDASDEVSRAVAVSRRAYQGGNEGALAGGARDPINIFPTPIGTPIPGGVASRNASSIVIVNETDVAGAMAGQVLARANPAPLLLSPTASLPASVAAEITRIRPAGVYIVGGTDKLSATVASDAAAAAGIDPSKVVRLAGGSDAATAALMPATYDTRAQIVKDADVPAFDAAIIANPATPGAAAAVGLAAARRLPILYVSQNSVPAETLAALDTLDIKDLIVVGNTDDVSAAVLSQLDALPKVTGAVTRRGGATVYDTSKAIVLESANRGLPSNVVYLADGANPMDAALLGGYVARATGMLVLAPAPLYANAAGQVSDFGLTGVDRLILLGPPSAAVTPPPVDNPPPPPPVDNPPPSPPPSGGSPPPPPAPVPGGPAADTKAPVLSKVSLTRRSFKARLGTSIKLTLSKDAKVKITVALRSAGRRVGKNCVGLTPVTRKRAACVRYVTRGSLSSSRKAGTSTVKFTGRVAGRFLTPAGYRFTLVATDSGKRRSKAINVTFTVVR